MSAPGSTVAAGGAVADIAKVGVLVFPAEAENAFELFDALRYATRLRVWGASSRPGYANLLFPRLKDDLPPISDPGFLDALNAFVAQAGISLIFPTHDDVALYMAAHAAQIRATVVGSDLACAEVCREKRRLYQALAGEAFCPRVFGETDPVDEWPVFAKPNRGQGGVGAARVGTPAELDRLRSEGADLVVSEFLPGEEFTVDCFSDRHGQLRFAGPRSRDVVRMGIAFVSRVVPLDAPTQQIAQALNERFRPRGLWFFQVKRDAGGRLKLLEMSCRVAGTMSVYRQLGVNLPLLAVFDALGMDVQVLRNDLPLTLRRRLQSSYATDLTFDTVYVDYDDTVIVDGQVNAVLMQFLYECRNRGRRLVLLTKHAGDLAAHMRAFHIPESLFDRIDHLDAAQRKVDFITDRNAILIDNLFAERRDAARHAGIAVFDVDAVPGLLGL